MSEVKVGMRFRHPYADSTPTWEVREQSCDEFWVCEIVEEDNRPKIFPGGCLGQQNVFKASTILARLTDTRG